MHSATVEDYLKALFELAVPGRGVSTNELAKRMGVRAASVTQMLQRLARRSLVTYAPYRGATLTEAGRRSATAVLRRHRILELFLHRMCGMRLEQVHQEAERLEHAASDDFVEALDRLLGRPRLDPHGDPIPDRKGTLREDCSCALSDLAVGARAAISRVEDERPEALRFLVGERLVPGTTVTLLRRIEFDGSLEVRIGRRRLMLNRDIARCLRVKPVRPGRPAP